MRKTTANNGQRRRTKRVAVIALMASMSSAHAFKIDAGNPDVAMRLDTTVRYNLAVRANEPGPVGNNFQFDESDYKFSKRGDVVTNRLDVLPEFDFVYKKRMGFRLSAAGWYDNAYDDTSTHTNPALIGGTSASAYTGGEYSPYTKRYYRGPSGEILDAFVFFGLDLGDMPLSVKAGKHTTIWGESLFTTTHGISYGQSPLDFAKAFATPGIEAKELFRPLNQISAQLGVAPNFSLAAQYFLDWSYSRLPEGGTYLGIIDMGFNGPTNFDAVGFGANAGNSRPDKRGDWGVSARWSPEWLDGTLGFYYRNFTDKTPALFRFAPSGTGNYYQQFYGEDIDLYGLSLSKSVGPVSVGAELSYRNNMPLYSPLLAPVSGAAASAVIYPNGVPTLDGNSYQARGKTMHAVVNGVAVLGQGSVGGFKLYDTAVVLGELTYSRLVSVSSNRDMYQGLGYGVCDASRAAALGAAFRDKWDGCSTRSALGVALSFTPSWLQVFPGMDVLAPLSVSKGLYGNSPVTLGGNQGNGSYSIGIAADMYAKYRFDLRYVDYFGRSKYAPQAQTGTQVLRVNGLSTLLNDRGFVALTFKATF
ncbi:MAG TPA: DUF1302 domain-containing protein [Methylibium sp.]|nr:DUF1302 domain-containing protein [Methylibium sp.]